MSAHETRSPEEIEASIRRTRADIDATLRALEQRLTPRQLMDEGMNYLRQSGGAEFVSNLRHSVKDNPMPVTLAGIGLAWLMISDRRDRRSSHGMQASAGDTDTHTASDADSDTDTRGRQSEAAGSVKDKLSSAGQKLSETTQRAGQKLSETRQQVGQKLSETRQQVGQKLSQTTEGGRLTLDETKARAGELAQRARDQVQRVQGGLQNLLREQPLALGAIGLAIGAVIAASAPRTRKEDELMGEASDRLTDRVSEAGKEQLEGAESTAADTGESEKPGAPSASPGRAAGRGAQEHQGKRDAGGATHRTSPPQSPPGSGARR
jgi:ElaB/YqjD/DUF883 family membrane-anchored ribosome-binding protein